MAHATRQPSAAEAYDASPYPRMAHRTTHPMHLATLATLLGMEPAAPSQSRVLELGCAAGSNLIPMALAYPKSTFVGIDVSGAQVDVGRKESESLGIGNLTLLEMDVLDADARLGEFDYIIAHGLYSWVPPDVRDRAVALCRALLAPQGVALISYNAYPGWHLLDSIRAMMIYHVRDISEPNERVRSALEFLDFLSDAVDPRKSPYGFLLNSHRAYLREGIEQADDLHAYVLHDHLETVNQPVYFNQFADHIARHQLQYLCDADFHTDFIGSIDERTRGELGRYVKDPVELQQYLDFVRNRMFRRSIVCREEVAVQRMLKPEHLLGMRISSHALPAGDGPVRLSDDSPATFAALDGVTITMNHPLSKAGMTALLHTFPRDYSLHESAEAGLAMLRKETGDDSLKLTAADMAALATNLLQAFTAGGGLVQLTIEPPAFASEVSERTVGSRWARHELQHGPYVTNLNHERVMLEPLEVEILRLLDGSRDEATVVGALVPLVASGDLIFHDTAGDAITADAGLAELEQAVHARLRTLARARLLEE